MTTRYCLIQIGQSEGAGTCRKAHHSKSLDFNTFAPQYSLLFSDARNAVKGLVAMDLDGTRDKLVVAFDVDAQRQHNIVMKYNVQVNQQFDRKTVFNNSLNCVNAMHLVYDKSLK